MTTEKDSEETAFVCVKTDADDLAQDGLVAVASKPEEKI